MNSQMIKFFLSSGVPCGFIDSEGEFQMNLTMSDLLHSMILSAELKTLIEKAHSERAPFSLMCNLPSDFKKSPTVWQFHFLPLLGHDKEYLGSFFHAHEFLFLSPLDYVDGMQPYAVSTEKPNKLFTDREWEVLFFIMHRLSSKEIGGQLDISSQTVDVHLKSIYRKTNVHFACQLRAFCRGKGINRYIPPRLLSSDRQRISSHAVN